MAGRDDKDLLSGAGSRKAIAKLNKDLDRVARRKSPKLLETALMWLLVAAVGVPLGWVGLYRVLEAPATALMIQRAFEGEDVRRRTVPLAQISPHLVRAVIAAEDSGFCRHQGFEVEAIKAALERNQSGKSVRGASTISQQTAKNLFLWPERSWLRKGLEAYFTVLIEALWPKERILEAYLNAAEWGDGLFGAEAAAQARFGVSAKDLTPLQAARLAAVLPSPNKWSADRPGPYVRKRTGQIMARAQAVRTQGLADCVPLANAERPASAPKTRRRQPEPEPAPQPLPPLEPAAPGDLLRDIEQGLAQPPPAEPVVSDAAPPPAEATEAPVSTDAAAPPP